MLGKCLENVREKTPLVHCITNYVTVNDVANVLLGAGASPIMSDEPEDAKKLAEMSSALYLNIGTLNKRTIEACFFAGEAARSAGVPILLDPVGAGATPLRTDTARKITEKLAPKIIRANISEIKALLFGTDTTRGVDADAADVVNEENLDKMIGVMKSFSEKTGAVIAVTGKIDLVADSEKCYVIRNGSAVMSKITGTGCMLSGLCAAFAAANGENVTEAVAAAVCDMGIAGELGAAALGKGEGNATLRNRIIDAIYNMDSNTLEKGARYEIR